MSENKDDFSDIDTQSWGKPKKVTSQEKEWKAACAEANARIQKRRQDRSPSENSQTPRENGKESGETTTTRVSRQRKILTPVIFAEKIAGSAIHMAGEASVKNWMLHHASNKRKNTIRTGELDYLIEIYRQLKKEGYE